MRAKKKLPRRSQSQLHRRVVEAQKQSFLTHAHELRKRICYIALSVGLFAAAAYGMQQQLISLLLRPAGSQQFIYTTPGGGFDFQFKLCLYAGIALSIPVIIFHIFRYIHPIMRFETKRFIGWTIISSSLLAMLGILCGYSFGLPAAMSFLLQNFSGDQIKALITIQSYIDFVLVYLLAAALLFQLPLITLLINRIKPLQPQALLRHHRWFIFGAFIIGAVLSPTPDVRNQLMLTIPILLMYSISILLVWFVNHPGRKTRRIKSLLEKDMEAQAKRIASFKVAYLARQKNALAQSRPTNTISVPIPLRSPRRLPRRNIQEFTRATF